MSFLLFCIIHAGSILHAFATSDEAAAEWIALFKAYRDAQAPVVVDPGSGAPPVIANGWDDPAEIQRAKDLLNKYQSHE